MKKRETVDEIEMGGRSLGLKMEQSSKCGYYDGESIVWSHCRTIFKWLMWKEIEIPIKIMLLS